MDTCLMCPNPTSGHAMCEPCRAKDRAQQVGPYTRGQLNDMFDRLHDPGDWKAPIEAWVREVDLDLAQAAVEFYTATEVAVVAWDGRYCKIKAAGYRAGPAGDH